MAARGFVASLENEVIDAAIARADADGTTALCEQMARERAAGIRWTLTDDGPIYVHDCGGRATVEIFSRGMLAAIRGCANVRTEAGYRVTSAAAYGHARAAGRAALAILARRSA